MTTACLSPRRCTKAAIILFAVVSALAVAHALPSEARAAQSTVTVAKSPSEGGTVTGEGIDCGTDCSESFDARETCEGGDEITPPYCYDYWGTDLTATPADRYAFDHWEDCPGPWQNHCQAWLAEGESRMITAHFRLAECSDGKNNDSSDEKVDYPEDPDCESPSDDTEATTPPPLTVTPASIGLTNDTTPTVEFSSTESGVSFRCSVIASKPFYEPVPGHVFTNYTEDNCTSPFTTRALPEGDAIISIYARDAKGHESWERRTLTVDTTAPDSSISSGPEGLTNDPTPTFEWTGSDDRTAGSKLVFSYKVDGGQWSEYSGAKTVTLGDNSALTQGEHTFSVKAKDEAGNEGTPAQRSFTLDSEAPDTTISSGPPEGPTRSTSASFAFASSESGSSFECRLDGASSWSPCSSPKSYSSLSDGNHGFEVAAIDGAGNRDASPARRTWKVDTVAPRVTAVTPSSGAAGVSPRANVLATFSEAMRPNSINTATAKLVRMGTSTPLPATVTYNSTLKRAKLDPSSPLRRGTSYRATVTTGVKDLAGNPLGTKKSWSFTVAR